MTEGYEVSRGFLKIVADYKEADRGVDQFTRDVNGRLHDARGRFIAEGRESGKGYGEGLAGGLSGITSKFSGIGKGFAGAFAAGFKPTLFAGLAGAVIELAPLLAQSLGALALIPAAAGAAGLGIGTLAVGMHGLGDAFGAMGQQASGAAVDMQAVAMAERRLADAQRNAKKAQKDLTQARRDAKEANEDLARSLTGAQLDQREAAFALADAEAALAKARAQGDPEQIARMQLAYEQAQLAVANAADQVEDLTEAKAKSDKKGVEGSDQVQAALERQRKAIQEVADAQAALAKAQTASGGGVNKFAEALGKLAPSAAAFVLAVKSLGPAFGALRLDVQQKLFAGLGESFKTMAMAWLPALQESMGIVATGLNTVAKDIFGLLTKVTESPKFEETMNHLANAVVGVAKILPGLISGFGTLIKVGAPYIETLGNAFGRLGDTFAAWMDRLEESGQLDTFISNGLNAITLLSTMISDLGRIVMAVFNAMGSASFGAAGAIGDLLGKLADFFNSAPAMQAMTAAFTVINQALSVLVPLITGLLPPLAQVIGVLGTALMPLLQILTSDFVPIIVDLAKALADALVPVIEALAPALASVLKALAPVIKMLAGTLGKLLVALAPLIAQVATLLGEFLTAALEQLAPLFEQLLPVILELVAALLPPLMTILKAVGDVLIALMPVWGGFAHLLVAILVPVLKILTPVLKFVATAIGWIAQALAWVITPIAEFISWITRAITTMGFWKGVGDFFVGMWQRLVLAVKFSISWIAARIREFVDRARAHFERVGQGIRKIIGWFVDLKAKVDENIRKVVRFIKDIPDKIGNLKDKLIEKGKDVARGLWEGIKSMGGWLKTQLLDWVYQYIPKPIAEALGIKSPSKVMADRVGRHIPTGIVAGAKASAGAARRSLASMAASLVPTAPTVGGAQFAMAGGASASSGRGGVGDIWILADFGDGVRQVVKGVIASESQLVAQATDRGRQARSWAHPSRAKK